MASSSTRKRSAPETLGGLDDPPRRRTRSQTRRERLSERLWALDPAAITRAVQVLEDNGQERQDQRHDPQEAQQTVTCRGRRRASQTMSSSSFVLSPEDVARFKDNVVLVRGYSDAITELNGRRIEGVAYPITSQHHTSGVGNPATVSRRAGDGDMVPIKMFEYYYVSGSPPITGLFGRPAVASVPTTPLCFKTLEATYTRAVEIAQRELLENLVIAAISSQRFGVPCEGGAQAALRGILRFLLREKWPGVVGILCEELMVMNAFTEEKQAMMQAFNA